MTCDIIGGCSDPVKNLVDRIVSGQTWETLVFVLVVFLLIDFRVHLYRPLVKWYKKRSR